MEIIRDTFRTYHHALSRFIHSPRILVALGIVALLALVWFTFPVSQRGGGSALPPSDRPTPYEFAGGGKQRCRVEPFEVVVAPGATVEQSVIHTPSYSNAPYRLFIGDLPHGVSIFFHPDAGRGGGVSQLEIRAAPDAPSGSYSIAVLYREKQEDGATASAVCQLNLIVR